MWPGQQPPGGEQNPQQQNNPYQQPGYQQPNPYQQPGFQQPNPYAQQPQWGTPAPVGTPEPPRGGGGNRTKLVAIVAALAVVVTAGVTGFLVLGGDKDDQADDVTGKDGNKSASPTTEPSVTASPSADNPRGGEAEQPTVPGWKVVVNPKWGTAFDVPADWTIDSPGTFIGFEDEKKGDGSALIGMSAPAYFKEKWCTSDADKDGRTSDSNLAAAGTKGQNGAKNTDEVARNDSAWWAFGGYTDQSDASKKLLTLVKPKPFTTASGVQGSVASAYTKGVKKEDKCDSDGKATTFAFKNSAGDYVAWSLYGAKGVSDELPEKTILKILSTVRLHGEPTG
ncbi:hypothetical protein CLM62_26665 [Streptomyces sp. SA15]|uniref:hypothetical protein n=1 Tax=Streptomyces sp. SA15 TaxID=934019 RepID=UPI000BB00AF8|nr:hypothetical protein [Streptomyces sp. SA15]PAZ13082.1 hypothetical protein CLM62_26665 [Streptomyces sp. SA15]